MKKILILLLLVSMAYSIAEAGLSKINSIKVITITSKSDYISKDEIDTKVIESFAAKLPKMKIGKSGKITCEIRYSDGYYIINDETFGSYYLSIIMKSDFKKYDKISLSRKIYWERGFFMPSINSKDINESVRNNIGNIIDVFVVEWYKDKEETKK